MKNQEDAEWVIEAVSVALWTSTRTVAEDWEWCKVNDSRRAAEIRASARQAIVDARSIFKSADKIDLTFKNAFVGAK